MPVSGACRFTIYLNRTLKNKPIPAGFSGGDFQCFAQICGLSAKLVVSLFPITKNIIFIRLLFMAYNLLKGKRGIIFGALNDASIAWKVAERASEEGAQIVLTNTPVACRMGTIDELAKKTNATIIPADATSVDDLEKLFVQAQEVMGGKIDFVLHSVAMSVNMRKKRTYDDLDYGFLNKTLDISAISFHKMIQTAKKLDAINENGSILALSYVAAQRTFFGYNDMADA